MFRYIFPITFLLLGGTSLLRAESFTLESAVAYARKNNADLAAARFSIDEASARLLQAGRLSNPEVESELTPNVRGREYTFGIGFSQKFPLTNRLRLEPLESETTLLEITDLSEVYAIARIPEQQAGKMKAGTIAHIQVAALGEEKTDGELLKFGTEADSTEERRGAGRPLPNSQGNNSQSVQSIHSEKLLELFQRLQMRRQCSRLCREDGKLRCPGSSHSNERLV